MMSAPVILWIALLFALAVLFAYRKIVDNSVDDLVHVSDPSGQSIANRQAATAHKLEQLDRVAKILAIVLVVYGLALCVTFVYQALSASS